jgi:serine/threonine protein kinase
MASTDALAALDGSALEDQWRFETQIASGDGFSIYSGSEIGSGKPVLIEVVAASSVAPPPEQGRRAELLDAISHPGLLPVLDVGVTHDGARYAITDHPSGEALTARLRRLGKLEPEAAAQIAVGVTRVLEAVHAAGAVHANLHPARVFVTDQNDRIGVELALGLLRPCALDLDSDVVAKTIRAGHPRCPWDELARVVSTPPPYCAPEQLLGAPATARSDLYSVGVLLFQMVQGHPPHPLATAAAIAAAELALEPHSLNPAIPLRLRAVIGRALADNPARRQTSARVLAVALERALRRLPSTRSIRSAASTRSTSGDARSLPATEPLPAPLASSSDEPPTQRRPVISHPDLLPVRQSRPARGRSFRVEAAAPPEPAQRPRPPSVPPLPPRRSSVPPPPEPRRQFTMRPLPPLKPPPIPSLALPQRTVRAAPATAARPAPFDADVWLDPAELMEVDRRPLVSLPSIDEILEEADSDRVAFEEEEIPISLEEPPVEHHTDRPVVRDEEVPASIRAAVRRKRRLAGLLLWGLLGASSGSIAFLLEPRLLSGLHAAGSAVLGESQPAVLGEGQSATLTGSQPLALPLPPPAAAVAQPAEPPSVTPAPSDAPTSASEAPQARPEPPLEPAVPRAAGVSEQKAAPQAGDVLDGSAPASAPEPGFDQLVPPVR